MDTELLTTAIGIVIAVLGTATFAMMIIAGMHPDAAPARARARDDEHGSRRR